MTPGEIIMRLAAIGLLSAFLVARHRRRLRAPLPPEDPAVWNGHGLDTRLLRPRLESVRDDYAAAIHKSPPLPESGRRRAWARQVVSSLAYFHHRRPEVDPEHQTA